MRKTGGRGGTQAAAGCYARGFYWAVGLRRAGALYFPAEALTCPLGFSRAFPRALSHLALSASRLRVASSEAHRLDGPLRRSEAGFERRGQ